MKTKLGILALLLAIATLRAATNDLTTALQKGLFEEEANHNLAAAIQAYQSVIARFDQDRKLAATAIFRLGECYRKQGNTNDATAQYERVLREFPDQTPLVTLSRQYTSKSQAANQPGSDASEETAKLVEDFKKTRFEVLEIRSRIDRLESAPAEETTGSIDDADLRQGVEKVVAALRKLDSLKAGSNAPPEEVARAQKSFDTLSGDVTPKVNNYIAGLKAREASLAKRAETIQAQLETLRLSKDLTSQATSPAPPTSAEAEEVKAIQAMIKNSPDLINAASVGVNSGMSALSHAAFEGHLVVARFLLDNGADVDGRSAGAYENLTPLFQAVMNGHKAMVELLLDRKAKIDKTDAQGKTPLVYAVQKGFRSIVEVLLAHGADVNAKNQDGSMPLHFAAGAGSKSMVELLLAHGADVNAATLSGGTALHYQNDLSIAEVLIAHNANVNTADRNGRTPLSMATEKGNVSVAQLLLSKGASVDAKASDGLTPLVFAVARKQKEMVDTLLKAKADPNVRFDFDRIRWYGAPVQPPAIWKDYTPLLLATRDGSVEIAASLLTYNADPNLSGAQGDFPILNAMTIGDSKSRRAMITLLLDHGADPNVADIDQKQPALMRAVNIMDKETAGILIAHKANVNAKDRDGSSPLELAVYSSQNRDALAVAELLLANGADINFLDSQGKTPLNRAKDRAKNFVGTQKASVEDMIALLLKNGAVEDMPRVDRIEVTRASVNCSQSIFSRSTNDWNQFTLLELIAVKYHFLSDSPERGPGDGYYAKAFANNIDQTPMSPLGRTGKALPFPDLSRIRIRRPAPDLKTWQASAIDLSGLLDGGECSKDIQLRWGDVVEIPEADHPLNERWSGFSKNELANMNKCLTRHVAIIIKGQTNNLTLGLGISYSFDTNAEPVIRSEMPLWLRPALRRSNLLLASSDLTRIKTTRTDPATGQKHEWVVDCSEGKPAPDLWLRDGDVIEVPEKQ